MPLKVFASFEEFWPFYLGEHSMATNRTIHCIGTFFGLVTALSGIMSGELFYLLLAPMIGYSFAWFGHFVIEKNKPATLKYPFYSFLGDFKMFGLWMTMKLNQEVDKLNIKGK